MFRMILLVTLLTSCSGLSSFIKDVEKAEVRALNQVENELNEDIYATKKGEV